MCGLGWLRRQSRGGRGNKCAGTDLPVSAGAWLARIRSRNGCAAEQICRRRGWQALDSAKRNRRAGEQTCRGTNMPQESRSPRADGASARIAGEVGRQTPCFIRPFSSSPNTVAERAFPEDRCAAEQICRRRRWGTANPVGQGLLEEQACRGTNLPRPRRWAAWTEQERVGGQMRRGTNLPPPRGARPRLRPKPGPKGAALVDSGWSLAIFRAFDLSAAPRRRGRIPCMRW